MFYRDFVYRLMNRFGKARGWVGGGHLRAKTLPADLQILPQNDPSPLPNSLHRESPASVSNMATVKLTLPLAMVFSLTTLLPFSPVKKSHHAKGDPPDSKYNSSVKIFHLFFFLVEYFFLRRCHTQHGGHAGLQLTTLRSRPELRSGVSCLTPEPPGALLQMQSNKHVLSKELIWA